MSNEKNNPASTKRTATKPKRASKSYDPKYEKSRKQKPVSFSVNDETQARLLDFIGKFEYGVYFKNILAQLNDIEQKSIIDGDMNTIPSSLIKQNIIKSKTKVSEYFTVVDAVREFDHNDLAKHLSDDALLKELANRNLAAMPKFEGQQAISNYSVKNAAHLTEMPIVNEFGCVEVANNDGTVTYVEAEHYEAFVAKRA